MCDRPRGPWAWSVSRGKMNSQFYVRSDLISSRYIRYTTLQCTSLGMTACLPKLPDKCLRSVSCRYRGRRLKGLVDSHCKPPQSWMVRAVCLSTISGDWKFPFRFVCIERRGCSPGLSLSLSLSLSLCSRTCSRCRYVTAGRKCPGSPLHRTPVDPEEALDGRHSCYLRTKPKSPL